MNEVDYILKMKLHIFLINLLFFVSQNLFAQEKSNREVEIVFKAKSTKLSKVEKEKIRKFVENNPLDSNEVYSVMEYNKIVNSNLKLTKLFRKRMLKNYGRVYVIIKEIGKVHQSTDKIEYSFLGLSKKCNFLKIKILPNVRGCEAPPFPNLKK
jgi:hypothetical protein